MNIFPERLSEFSHNDKQSWLNTPCKEVLLAASLLLLALSLLHFDIIFLGKTFLAGWMPGVMPTGAWEYTSTHRIHSTDMAGGVWSPLPQTVSLHDAWASGDIPLWDPYMGGGAPLAANIDSIAFNPLRIPLYLFPNLAMWDAYCLFRLFIAGFGMFLLLRQLQTSFFSSLLGGFFFLSSGYFVLYINLTHLDAEVLLPFLFLLAEKLRQEPKRNLWFILFIFTLYLALNGGNPEASILTIGSTLLWFFWRLFTEVDTEKTKQRRSVSLLFLLALFLAILIAAIQLIPFIEYWMHSFNHHDSSGNNPPGMLFDPFPQSVMMFFIPWLFGDLLEGWLPLNSLLTYGKGYANPLCGFFALYGIIHCLKQKSWHSPSCFFLLLLLLSLGKVYGVPVIHQAGELPLLNMIVFVKYLGAPIAFCFAFLAAKGFEALSSLSREDALRDALITVAVLAFSLLIVILSLPSSELAKAGHQLREALLFSFGTTTLALFLLFFPFKKTVLKRSLTLLFPLLLVAEAYFLIPVVGIHKQWDKRFAPFKKAPYIQLLQTELNHERISAVGAHLFPDYAGAFQISDVRMLDAVMPKRYMEYLRSVIPIADGNYYTGAEHFDYRSLPYQRMLNLFGVKFLLAQIPLNIKGLVPVYTNEVIIYENLNVLPRTFLANHYRVVEDKKEVLKLLHTAELKLRDELIVEKQLPETVRKSLEQSRQRVQNSKSLGTATIHALSWNRVEIDVDAKESALLFLSDTFFPGWRATVDGNNRNIYRTDYLFRSLYIEKGKHAVVFSYCPASFSYGLGISCFGLLLLTGFCFKRKA